MNGALVRAVPFNHRLQPVLLRAGLSSAKKSMQAAVVPAVRLRPAVCHPSLPSLLSSCFFGICHEGSVLGVVCSIESRALNQGRSFRARYIIINVISMNHLHV